jgi:ABC-type nitrate/sulfonate/bicarbonate transport system substrate-binding protein
MRDNGPLNGMQTVRAGYVALTDCAPIIVAQELGFDRQAGIRFEPVRLKSWTAVRDALAFEKLECAHMPGALSLAMHLGLSGVQTDIRVPLMLGCGGNAITLSTKLFEEASSLLGARIECARADSAVLVQVVARHRKESSIRKVRLGSVHPYSSHNYELRAWLAQAGLDPDKDVELSVVPRSKMVEALANGEIDGYCVGDPWGQLAVEAGVGVTVATKADLYPYSPEKVLAFRASWLQGHNSLAAAAKNAVKAAMDWCADTDNHSDLSQILAQGEYLGASSEVILRALSCRPRLAPGDSGIKVVNYLGFSGLSGVSDASALWLLAQMRRWGQVPEGLEKDVRGVFAPLECSAGEPRPQEFKDIETVAVDPARQAFDGVPFTANNIEDYWRSFPISCGE